MSSNLTLFDATLTLGSSIGEAISSLSSSNPYIPMEFDLLMQSSLPPAIKPMPSPRVTTPPIEASTTLLVPLAETAIKQYDTSNGKQPRQDSDVSMLDTGVSSTENSIGGNEDVQLLHSPPLSTPTTSTVTAPALSDISLKFEEIKPSNNTY